MTKLEVLKAAREKIADEKHWTTGVSARDSAGVSVAPSWHAACRWCALGAVWASGSQDDTSGAADFLDRVARPIAPPKEGFSNKCPAARVNDSSTHAQVLALFDKAIAQLESEQP